MVTRDSAWPAGTPCWVDLSVDDIPKAKAFYGGLFGWDVQEGPPETGGYAMCMLKDKAAAGIGPKQGGEAQPTAWTTYIASDDADETAAKIKAAGGTVISEPFDVMDVGRMAVAMDPGGAVFGVWQARAHTGAGIANEPGSYTWNENMSRAYEANKDFYSSVFGYQINDIGAEGMDYSTMDLNGQMVGGIGAIGADQPAEMPAAWVTYFNVDNADASVATAQQLGGSVIAPPFDTPYGRMAVLADDQGGVFALMQNPSEG